jgi:hypothetical protein
MDGPNVTTFGVILFVGYNLLFSYFMFRIFIFATKMNKVESQRRPTNKNAKGIFSESVEMFSDYRKEINEEYSKMKGD